MKPEKKETCHECHGFSEESRCCGSDFEEIMAQKDEKTWIGSGKYKCTMCGKFCQPIPCKNCYGYGYEIDEL